MGIVRDGIEDVAESLKDGGHSFVQETATAVLPPVPGLKNPLPIRGLLSGITPNEPAKKF